MPKGATLEEMLELYEERPRKLSTEQVGYEAAPEGSALRCSACRRFYLRAIDNFGTCEILRSDVTDEEGVRPDFRCRFWTCDGTVYPLYEDEEVRE